MMEAGVFGNQATEHLIDVSIDDTDRARSLIRMTPARVGSENNAMVAAY